LIAKRTIRNGKKNQNSRISGSLAYKMIFLKKRSIKNARCKNQSVK